MKKARLLKLAKLLKEDAANPKGMKFDLRIWANNNSDEKTLAVDCSTSGCAIGLACLSGAFESSGLTFKLIKIDEELGQTHYSIRPQYQGYLGESAVRNFFNISSQDFFKLFMPESYKLKERRGSKGELAVAARIRKFVEEGQ